jgi:hypothetical protein
VLSVVLLRILSRDNDVPEFDTVVVVLDAAWLAKRAMAAAPRTRVIFFMTVIIPYQVGN